MKVYALSGSSGTGKSTSALLFAHNHDIPVIIDDGLLIYNGTKIAGSSAKYEQNTITAIKRAVFFYDDHRYEIINKLKKINPHKILLIGTSKRMVKQIAERLELGEIDQHIDVKDIRTSSEIKMAEFIRRTQGEHVIPIPSIQIEHGLFKKLILKGTQVFSKQRKIIGETTVVRPNFQLGSISISPDVLKQIVAYRCRQTNEIESYQHIKITLDNFLPIIKLQIEIKAKKDANISAIIKNLQDDLRQDFLQHLNVEVYTIDTQVAKMNLV